MQPLQPHRVEAGEDIKQEIACVEETWPGYLAYFMERMEEGVVNGRSYVEYIGREELQVCTRCFYGWLEEYIHDFYEPAKKEVARKLGRNLHFYTPMELFIMWVDPWYTPETSDELAALKRVIEAYLSQQSRKEEEEEGD